MANYSQSQIQQMITDAARAQGVDPALALAVAKQESGFNPTAVSPPNKNGTQDYGLFQLNSSNLSSFGVTNPLDPQQNINAGVGYLAQLLQKYNGDVSTTLWAYNAGPGNVSNGILPSSTQNYISQIQASITQFSTDLPTDLTGSDSSTIPTDSGSVSAGIFSGLNGTISLFGYDVPAGYALGGAILAFGLLAFAISD